MYLSLKWRQADLSTSKAGVYQLGLWGFNPLDVKLFFCKTPVGARLIFSMILLGAELIFANLPPGVGLFIEPEKRRDPLRALISVTK